MRKTRVYRRVYLGTRFSRLRKEKKQKRGGFGESIGKRSIEEPKSTLLSDKLQGRPSDVSHEGDGREMKTRRRRLRRQRRRRRTNTIITGSYWQRELYVNHYIRENKTLAKTSRAMMMFWWCLYACVYGVDMMVVARGEGDESGEKKTALPANGQSGAREAEREGEISWEMFPPKHLFSRGRGPVCDPLASRYLPLFTLLGNETKRCDVRNNNGVTLYIYRGKKKRCGLLGHTERAILAAGKDTLLTRYGLESPLESHSQICKSYRGHPPSPLFGW